MANVIFGDPTAGVFYAAFLLYSAGFILFGFAVWGSGTLPGWAGVLLAVHAPLFSGRSRICFRSWGHCCCSWAAGGSPLPTYASLPPARMHGRVSEWIPKRSSSRQ